MSACGARCSNPCRESADETRQALAECNDYLDTIYPFVRERNGGREPAWMSELVSAHTTKECQEAFRTFLTKTGKPRADDQDAGGEAAPAARKQTAPTPRSRWTEQLPPWLAPPP